MRWLVDQFGSGILRQLEDGPSDGVTAIEAATGQSFPTLFGHFGLSLYTDSLPGLPRTTAPADLRFVSRNVSQLWARLYATSASSAIPTPRPLYLYPLSSDTIDGLHGTGHDGVQPAGHAGVECRGHAAVRLPRAARRWPRHSIRS